MSLDLTAVGQSPATGTRSRLAARSSRIRKPVRSGPDRFGIQAERDL